MKTKKVFFTIIAIIGFAITAMSQVTIKITAQGPTTFCLMGSVLLTGKVTPSGVYQYQWIRNGKDIVNANASSYTVYGSGSYQLKAIALDSSIFKSDSIDITVEPLPNVATSYNAQAKKIKGVPAIMLQATSSSNVSFQWYFNNNPISGATNNNYAATIGGAYKVVFTDLKTGCANTSQIMRPFATADSATEFGKVSFYTRSDLGKIIIDIGNKECLITDFFPSGTPTCGSKGCASFTLGVGTYTYNAYHINLFGKKWNGVIIVEKDDCKSILLE